MSTGEETTWVPVAGGELSIGHRPKKKALPQFKKNGVSAVFTLLSEREGASEIGAAATDAGLRWIWLPLPNGNPPERSQDAGVVARFGDVREVLTGGGRVFVHCSAGIHRTGMITYALLRFLGQSAESAKATLGQLRSLTVEGVGEDRLAWGEHFGAEGLSSP